MDTAAEINDALFVFARQLEEAGIPYMVTGSLALSFHAEPRNTHDADIVLQLDAGTLPTLLAMFPEEKGWYWSDEAARAAVANRRMFNVVQSKSGFKFDLIMLTDSEFEQEKFSRRIKLERRGVGIWLIRAEDPLLSKLDWGKRGNSALQAADVRTLLRDVTDLDWEYLNPRIDRFGLRE